MTYKAVEQIKLQGYRDVLVAGTMRLSTALMVGVELSDVAGFTVAIRPRDQEWGSAGDRAQVELARDEIELAQGDDLAVGISIAADLTADVVQYPKNEEVTVRGFINLSPAAGIRRDAIGGSAEARGYAQALLDALRPESSGGVPRLHLLQAGPLGLALLLGHVPAGRVTELPARGRLIALEKLDPIKGCGREFWITVRHQLLDEQRPALSVAPEPLRFDDLSEHFGVESADAFAHEPADLADTNLDGVDVVLETDRPHQPAAVLTQLFVGTAAGADLKVLEHLEELRLAYGEMLRPRRSDLSRL